jgi:hypothetical protein
MPASSRSRSLCLLASLGAAASLSLCARPAEACAPETAARWMPERSWPSHCEPDAVTDGAVLLDGDAIPEHVLGGNGELRVLVQRMVEGAPVEDFSGKISHPDGTSALFLSDRPLPASTDFQITAYRAGIDGTQIGDRYTSAFTTGTRALAPLAFASEPTLSYEESDRKRHTCSEDACGEQRCEATDEVQHVRSLRVAVPEITGGIDVKPYQVTAELVATFATGQAPAVATTDSAATQADKRSFFVLDLPPLAQAAKGCVTVSVRDVGGRTLKSEPVCMEFDSDDEPDAPDTLGADSQIKITTQDDGDLEPDVDVEELELSTSTDSASAEPNMQTASAAGCAIGRAGGSVGNLGWLGLALTLARLRRRRSASVVASRD